MHFVVFCGFCLGNHIYSLPRNGPVRSDGSSISMCWSVWAFFSDVYHRIHLWRLMHDQGIVKDTLINTVPLIMSGSCTWWHHDELQAISAGPQSSAGLSVLTGATHKCGITILVGSSIPNGGVEPFNKWYIFVESQGSEDEYDMRPLMVAIDVAVFSNLRGQTHLNVVVDMLDIPNNRYYG